ncbi:MAG: hypothetical protein LQ346_001568 [Caloplaca aetnensis]|nr:MAG: hypothetical protein LQ346_001568 [Caloplaca aetnensis]
MLLPSSWSGLPRDFLSSGEELVTADVQYGNERIVGFKGCLYSRLRYSTEAELVTPWAGGLPAPNGAELEAVIEDTGPGLRSKHSDTAFFKSALKTGQVIAAYQSLADAVPVIVDEE